MIWLDREFKAVLFCIEMQKWAAVCRAVQHCFSFVSAKNSYRWFRISQKHEISVAQWNATKSWLGTVVVTINIFLRTILSWQNVVQKIKYYYKEEITAWFLKSLSEIFVREGSSSNLLDIIVSVSLQFQMMGFLGNII